MTRLAHEHHTPASAQRLQLPHSSRLLANIPLPSHICRLSFCCRFSYSLRPLCHAYRLLLAAVATMTTNSRFRSSAGRAASAFVTTLLSFAALHPAQADFAPEHGDGSGILPVLPPGAPNQDASRQQLTRDMDFVSMLGPKADRWRC